MKQNIVQKVVFLSSLSLGSLFGGEIGVVNFGTCISESKSGKAEQASFEGIKKQMTSHLETMEKELADLAGKLNNPEYMDGLSPEAEEELRQKTKALNDELMQKQNQYYQILNQTNMKIVQQIGAKVAAAAESVAKAKKIDAVLNQEACFYVTPSLNVTDDVVKEMDNRYEEEMKKQTSGN